MRGQAHGTFGASSTTAAPGLADAQVQVREGGTRGMVVAVTLSTATSGRRADVERALAEFVFESRVGSD